MGQKSKQGGVYERERTRTICWTSYPEQGCPVQAWTVLPRYPRCVTELTQTRLEETSGWKVLQQRQLQRPKFLAALKRAISRSSGCWDGRDRVGGSCVDCDRGCGLDVLFEVLQLVRLLIWRYVGRVGCADGVRDFKKW